MANEKKKRVMLTEMEILMIHNMAKIERQRFVSGLVHEDFSLSETQVEALKRLADLDRKFEDLAEQDRESLGYDESLDNVPF